jgi:hypothetical protein
MTQAMIPRRESQARASDRDVNDAARRPLAALKPILRSSPV